jgi:hypothetical protein
MTPAQREALIWLQQHNGDGVFDKHGVLLAAGESAPFMRSTWNALRDMGRVEMYDRKRVRVTRPVEKEGVR